MIKKLEVHGFKTLVDTEIDFAPLTVLIGENGAGKTAILNALQILGDFARGGADRAFGPPPWSLSWQRTRGIGHIPQVRFEVDVELDGELYHYTLGLDETGARTRVKEERLVRKKNHQTLASFSRASPPASGTILNSTEGKHREIVQRVSEQLQSLRVYELNPSSIEQGNDPKHAYITRDGFGVAGFLDHLKADHPERYARLEERLKSLRKETAAIELWTAGDKLFWGLRDEGQDRAFPAVHLSWGDRQLVGILCILFDAEPGSIVAIEEIDRGFHHSRYNAILELLSEAAYDGLHGDRAVQLVITTHSTVFLNQLDDRLDEIRKVYRFPRGGTIVEPLDELIRTRLGSEAHEAPLNEILEMGLLDDPPPRAPRSEAAAL